MKTRFTWLGIVATLILGIAIFFVGCNKDGLNDVVIYKGQVVYINTTNPFADLTVKVTNGKDTHCQTLTDAGGLFSLKVRVSEIDGSYYLLAGDSTCIPKQVSLGGYGQTEVDLGVVEVEGPALPTVKTTPLIEVTAESATLGGEVMTDGRLKVTARGICYGTKAYPTIDGLHTTDGTGIGVFTSNLKSLEHNTIYYARAYATNSLGTVYDTIQIKFTTEEGVPVVTTDTIINITAHSAKCKCEVISDGGYKVTKRGICWSTHHDPTIDDNTKEEGSDVGKYMSTLNNLQENTIYYVRSFATNATDTKYGEEKMFTTLNGLAVVRTDSVPGNKITANSFMVYGTVLEDCDIPVTERGFCYSNTQYPTLENKHVTVNKGKGSFYATISGLNYSTTYYVRAYAINETATVYDSLQYEVTTLDGLPYVVTDSIVTNIGSVKATCSGKVINDGTLTVTARGICYGTDPQLTIEDSHTNEGKGLGEFNSNLKNLKDSTVYYFRAYATTDAGTAYGKEYTFLTKNGVPVVLLSKVGDPTANSVICEGNVTGDGGVTVTERGFCYSLTQYPTNTSDHVAIGNGIGEFKGSLIGLALNSTYYVRAYAVNSLGIGYSEQQSFTTKNGLPTVTTDSATTTATSITIGGNVTDNGGYAVTERGICYSATNSEPTIADAFVAGGKGNGEFSLSVTGLSASTTYYLCAYATNENGTSYGETKAVITKDGNAAVVLSEISNITALSASASVTVTDAGSATLQSCGICWSINPNPATSDKTIAASGKQLNTAYPCNLTELQPNTTYYVRAYATTDITTTYSEERTFNTVSGLPKVTTGVTTSTSSTITASGEVTDNGGYSVTERGVCYSKTNSEPTITDAKIASGSGNGTFNISITTLEVATTYYVRAYATNSIGTAYGEVVPVVTKDGSASVLLSEVSNVTALTASTSVTVTDAGGATIQSCGICWSITPNPTTSDNTNAASGKQLNTTYPCNLAELQPNTTYYVRGYATTDITTTYSEQKSFTTKTGSADVILGDFSNITALSASGSVTVTDANGATLQSCGICWATIPNPTIANQKTVASGKVLQTAYNCAMTNLAPSTVYYVRAYATTDITTSYSPQKPFTTTSGLPVLTTKQPSATSVNISSGGNISSDGGYAITARGLCYSTNNSEPTLSDSYTTSGTGSGSFKSVITNVSVSTTYYVRAYATNSIGTGYGDVYSVTTGNGLPSVTTTVIGDNVTSSSAIGGGNVTDDGGYIVTARGVCWSTLPNPTIADSKTIDGSGKGYFTSNITGIDLTGSNTYYVRAYATNANGTTYGQIVTISKENLDYASLPSVQYGGYIYRLYPDMGTMSWSAANSACENLNYGGYNDWYLPTSEEIPNLIRLSTAGWMFDGSRNAYGDYITKYWTSTPIDEDLDRYYYVLISLSTDKTMSISLYSSWLSNGDVLRVRPVRKYLAQ